jgi:hypothetical protein
VVPRRCNGPVACTELSPPGSQQGRGNSPGPVPATSLFDTVI